MESISTKIQKVAGHGGACLYSQLLRRLRQENHVNPGGGACSEPRSRHYTQARATVPDSISKKKNAMVPLMDSDNGCTTG